VGNFFLARKKVSESRGTPILGNSSLSLGLGSAFLRRSLRGGGVESEDLEDPDESEDPDEAEEFEDPEEFEELEDPDEPEDPEEPDELEEPELELLLDPELDSELDSELLSPIYR
jgi:hypothetical protein